MPTTTSPRWVADSDAMIEQFEAMGYNTEREYAENKPEDQAKQIQGMIDRGDKLLVIAAVDGSALTEQLKAAEAKGIQVIAYDRLLTGESEVDYQATFDNVRVGQMQAQLLVDRLDLDADDDKTYNIEWFAGSSTDNNAQDFYDGNKAILQPYLRSGKIKIVSGERRFNQMTTKDYLREVAQERMTRLLDENYQNQQVDAVLSPYDGMSLGIIDALKEAGYGTDDKPLPVVSGQDAELDSVKSIIAGEQAGTIFKDTRELAKVAVEQGNAMLTGTKPIVNEEEFFENELGKVPTYLLYPVAIEASNYKTLLVDSGYYEAEALMS
nr:sugar-binding protein [Kineosporia babensis]